MENTPAFHPLDYVSVLRRRLWWLFAPLVLAIVAGAALITWLPRQYETSATLGVSLAAVTNQLITEAQKVTVEERLRNINQLLTGDAVIQRVVREEGLDRDRTMAEAVQYVRSRVATTPLLEPGLPNATVERFTVGYTDETPQAAQRVANRLVDTFVQESSRKRTVRAEETAMFIGMQVEASQQRLTDLESRLRAAKEAFMGALPEQTDANVAMVTGLQQQLETTTNAIRGEQDRLSMVERQIESMKAGAVGDVALPGAPGAASPASVRAVQIERELAAARGNYTEKHPEVVRLREEVAAAKAEAAAQANRPAEDREASLRVDPTYRLLLNDREQARLRIRELQRSEGQIRGQIGLYRARVESAPRVEQQLATVQREYDLEKEQYAALSARLRSAETNESIERYQGGERFAVISRAALPIAPSSPNTRRLMLVTVLFGLCLGGALALGREYLDRSIHDARALHDIPFPVLGEIPRIATAQPNH
jgi:polysaccharide chain length determinant protein (PEP-CTERM system associated)